MALSPIQLATLQNNSSTTPVNNIVNIEAQPSAAFRVRRDVVGIDQVLESASQLEHLAFPSDRPKYFMGMTISEYSRQDLLTVGGLTIEKNIILPLPKQLVDSHHTTYTETALGQFIGTGLNAVAASGGLNAVRDGLKTGSISNISQVGKSLDDIIGSISDTAQGLGVGAIRGALGNFSSSLQQAADSALNLIGYAPNQFLTILLQGPQYSRHEFSWQCTPRNFKESENIRKIIQLINNCQAPYLELGGAIFGYPKIFQLYFSPNSKYLFKFKPSVVESISVNYAGGGVPAFYRSEGSDVNSAPESIEINIRFLELEFWLRNDFKSSANPFDTHGGNNRYEEKVIAG